MDFICKRCDQVFRVKSHLKAHLQRKNPCESLHNIDLDRNLLMDELYERKLQDKTFDCEYCQMKFNHASGKSQHKRICKKKPTDKITELTNRIDILEEELKKNKMTNINNINNTQNNINVTIPKLKNFGWENMDAIPESLISSLFMNLRFKELLANLHCDPNFPENQNVRIKSIKRNTMEIYRNNKWDIVTFTKGLTDLLLQGHKIFTDYYNKDKKRILEEDMSKEEIKEILDQLEQIEKLNKDELRPLLVDLQMMLEEYRENGHAIVLA
jgi:hypothetical protein